MIPARSVGGDREGAIFFEAKNFQLTGSFKLRGAMSKLSVMAGHERLVTASSDNHGIGAARAARSLGRQLMVVLPETALEAKMAKIRSKGAEVLAASGAYVYVSPYNDVNVIAGQGTVRAGHVGAVQTEHRATLAEAVACGIDDDTITMGLETAVVDEVMACDEAEIAAVMRRLAFEENMVVEGAAALALAGFDKVAERLGRQTSVIVLCGGNVDHAMVRDIVGGGRADDRAYCSCYTCERRRIRCDLGTPGCRKCLNKGLACPGYGPRLRWAGGAATRGRLLQLQGGAVTDSATAKDSPPSPSPSTSSRTSGHAWMRSATWDALDGTVLRQLVGHWERTIACRMVWVDSPSNPYRTIVAPLASAVPVVGLALAAVSSQHASSSSGPASRTDAAFSELCRNEAVAMISAYVRGVADGGGLLPDREPVEWVLAAMMLLSCYEMTDSGAAAADFHRRAARSLVNTFDASAPADGGGGGVLFDFLRNQLAIHDVFACTTSFDASTMRDVVLPGRDDRVVLFSSYLVYLLDVTLLSRIATPSRARSLRLGLDMRRVQARFDTARGETLMAAGPLLGDAPAAARRRDFICVANVAHHAALLYAARCLELDGGEEARAWHRDALFDQLDAMAAPDDWLHCISWALFVAGVESHADGARQAVVTRLYVRLYEGMRFRNFRDALDFLRIFWAGINDDWRPLAAAWEATGRAVLLT